MQKRHILVALLLMTGALIMAACQPETEIVEREVTRVVTETVVEEGETVEVTRVVTETVEVTPESAEEEMAESNKDLIVCMSQEPDTLYPWGGTMLAAGAVQHGIFETDITTLSYDYQAHGLEKIPSLADGDAVLQAVEVEAGATVLDASGNPVALEEGVSIVNADDETVEFTGEPVTMQQLVVDFTMKPRVWSDGEPVKASDSVYSFNLVNHPDTPASKFTTNRTASYEATGELTTRWTGIPGFMDATYFINFWQPLPEHAWSDFTPAELLEAEASSRMPVGDGPFAITEWVAGDRIVLEPNEHYYRAAEGLPKLDSVTFKFIQDTNQLVAQLLAGQCDIGTQDALTAAEAPFLIEAETNGLVVPHFQTGTVYEHVDFGINSWGDYGDGIGRPDWFQDERVRQAMTMCTDRQAMVDNILYGRSEVIHSYVPSVHPLYPDGLTEWPYDVEQANALLDEVGYVDSDGDGIREDTETGTPFSVSLGTTTGNEMRQQLSQIFKENMLECGIDVTLEFIPADNWFADGPDGPLFGRRYDLGEFAWLTGIQPSCNLYLSDNITGPNDETNPNHYNPDQTYGGWGNAGNTGWINQEFDEVCKEALGSLPGTEAYEESHKEAQRIFSEEVPVIPLFLRLKVAATRPEVVNFGIDPTQNSELWNLFELDLQLPLLL